MNGITIEVNIATLLGSLEKSRAQHVKDYAKAKKGWQKLLHTELTNKLLALENGGKLSLHIENQKPESHLDEYDEAIEMLSYAANPTIVLTTQQFRQFVKDDWDWKRHWVASTSTYIEAAR
jgi:hypothetical protein